MAAFPTIIPTMRVYTAGTMPSTPFKALSGKEVRVLHSTVSSGHQLSLTFKPIRETVAKQIVDHYFGQRTTFDAFTLPSAVFNDLLYSSALNPNSNVWRYNAPVKVTPLYNGYYEVTADLISVPA